MTLPCQSECFGETGAEGGSVTNLEVFPKACLHVTASTTQGASLHTQVHQAWDAAEAVTSQPVASDKLAILTRGVLPINPAKP